MYRGFVVAAAAWIRLPAWVPLLRVTPPLSQSVSCHIFNCSVNKAKKKRQSSDCYYPVFQLVYL